MSLGGLVGSSAFAAQETYARGHSSQSMVGREGKYREAQPPPVETHTVPDVPPVYGASARGTPHGRSAIPRAPVDRSADTRQCSDDRGSTDMASTTPATRSPPVPAAPAPGAICQYRLPR